MQKYKTIPLYEAENRRSSALPCAKEQLWRLQRPLWYRTHSFVLNCFRSTIFNYFRAQMIRFMNIMNLQFLREEDGTLNPVWSLMRKCERNYNNKVRKHGKENRGYEIKKKRKEGISLVRSVQFGYLEVEDWMRRIGKFSSGRFTTKATNGVSSATTWLCCLTRLLVVHFLNSV